MNNNKNYKQVLLHMLYWLLLIGFYTLFMGIRYNNIYQSFIREISITPTRLVATYFILYYLIPRFIPVKKYIRFAVFLFLTLAASGLLQRILYHSVYYPLFVPNEIASPLWGIYSIFDETMNIVIALFIPLTYKLMQYWRMEHSHNQELAKQKLNAELEALKNQLNPHFLFNTLNNIYSLTLKKSELAPQIILKLSDILSYLLYESNKEKADLKSEISLINDYLELQKLRFGNKLQLNYSVEGKEHVHYIAPILFLPFIENAFKHGVSQQTENKWLNLAIRITEYQVFFFIENQIIPKALYKNNKKGIGLNNVTNRLNLLYKGKHALNISVSDTYRVELRIDTK